MSTTRISSLFVFLLALTLALVLGGCAAERSDDVGLSEGKITHEEAAAELALDDVILKDLPTSPTTKKKLGIEKWNVYTTIRKSDIGAIAFATDAKGDVRYAWVLDKTRGEQAVLEYDAIGMRRGATISQETLATLKVDFDLLDGKVRAAAAAESADRLDNKTRCALRVAAGLLAAGAAAAVVAYAMPAAEALFSYYLTFGQIELVAGSATVAATVAVAALVQTELAKTINVCKAAADGK